MHGAATANGKPERDPVDAVEMDTSKGLPSVRRTLALTTLLLALGPTSTPAQTIRSATPVGSTDAHPTLRSVWQLDTGG
jgi:hypothetical protein